MRITRGASFSLCFSLNRDKVSRHHLVSPTAFRLSLMRALNLSIDRLATVDPISRMLPIVVVLRLGPWLHRDGWRLIALRPARPLAHTTHAHVAHTGHAHAGHAHGGGHRRHARHVRRHTTTCIMNMKI